MYDCNYNQFNAVVSHFTHPHRSIAFLLLQSVRFLVIKHKEIGKSAEKNYKEIRFFIEKEN